MNQELLRPTTVEQAATLLRSLPGARLISGGATLVAMMNARLADPQTLISLAGIKDIQGIREIPGGGFRIGAFTRHRETSADARLAGTLGVVREAAGLIANATVRNMGTIGGSISFADPGLDYPPALVAADAVIEIVSSSARRRVKAEDFFVDWYTTALQPGELVAAVELPASRDGIGLYHKLARVTGDYATVSIAVSAWFGPAGPRLRVVVGACGPRPIRTDEADRLVSGASPDLAKAGALLREAADPVDDVRGSADYRRTLIPRMLERAVLQARAALARTSAGASRG